jgi:hypothetical protein
MWDYVCPRCKRDVPKKSHTCPHCKENYGVPLRVPPKILKDAKALSEYVHKVVMPKVSPEMRMYLTQFFTVLFSHGFEGGDFGNDPETGYAWTGIVGTPTIVETPHHGTYAESCNAAGEYAYYNLASGQNVLYVRVYFKLSAAFAVNGNFIYCIGIRSSSGFLARVGLKRIAGSTVWDLLYHDNGANIEVASATTASADTWYALELKVDCSSADGQTDGEYRVYVDGVEIADLAQANVDTDYTTCDIVRVGCDDGDFSAGGFTGIVDCVVVADAYIGPESEAALKTVTDALALSDGACRNKNFVIADTSGLTDAVLQHKTLVANDSVDVNDAVLTDKTVVTADAVNLAGSLIVDKILQVTETTNLFETVQVGVGGVKKTKLFLIIGDLAVQLAGE